MTFLRQILAVSMATLSLIGVAHAAESGWATAPEARARLVSGISATGVAETAPMGIQILMKEGWKTYWRAPGPQGYPPRLDWTGSENVAGAEIVWPTPERFTILGYDSIGYKDGALLPLNVALEDPSKPAKLRLAVDYLTCADICIPQLAELSLDLPAGPPKPTEHAFAIDKARGQAPSPPGAGDRVVRVWMEGPADQPTLGAEIETAANSADIDLFTDGLDGYFFRAPTIVEAADGRLILRSVAVTAPEAPAEIGQEAAYTVRLGKGRAIVQQAALGVAPTDLPAAPSASGGPSLLLMLGIAFLGGLILNVMPCVLPVLAIKLMGALKHAEGGRAAVRRGFLASAAGIVVSFLALAAGAIALQQAGAAVGWGMQFQQPLFVAFMALVMALFSANLWGIFDFGTPDVAGRAGSALPADDGLAGSFWTGVLATALATPCSAPFVGTALSFALTRGAGEIALIFAVMGLGLAAPYLLTAAFPALARLLPRPGRWMELVKRVLGLAVALTGIWLLWVLWRQAGLTASLLALGGAAAVVALIAFLAAPRRWAFAGAAAVAGLVAVWLTAAPADRAVAAGNIDWVAFEETAIPTRVARGEVVLVDVTADWCVTCKWNKAAVLSQDPVAPLLGAQVIAMQADWTRPDPAISDYLARNERFGIPFNIVYGPGAPNGVALPELLSADAVMSAIEKARGPGG